MLFVPENVKENLLYIHRRKKTYSKSQLRDWFFVPTFPPIFFYFPL